MLTSFETVSLYAVLSGLSGLSIGSRVLPSAKALGKARSDGRRRGRREAIGDARRRAAEGQVFRLSPDGEPKWCDAGSQWDIDGANAYYGWETGDDDHAPLPGTSVHGNDSLRDAGLPPPLVPGTGSDPQSGLRGLEERGGSGDGCPRGGDGPGDPVDAGSRDWADELSGMRTGIAVDEATQVLAAVPDPPSPGSFEYYASDWQQKFDHWLAGEMAELAKQRRRYERV